MAWTIKLTPKAEDDLRRLDRGTAIRIRDKLRNITTLDNPRQKGKALTGPLSDFWCYRTGDYRILCRIEDKEVIVLVVSIAHRSEVYKKRS
ncbi:MAG: type II toxin-antitoxin system RelE/ParE family toxin [Synergistaceae bacterium]|nr:type II toxin-antitoxin system RelE/ParE family toxin [Synergistaceae bacterium]